MQLKCISKNRNAIVKRKREKNLKTFRLSKKIDVIEKNL